MNPCFDPAVQSPERLAALRAYGVLDSAPESEFDDITLIAAEICAAPIALVSLVEDARQWFKSAVGLPVRETPIEPSFCAHAMLRDDLLIVENAALDPRFADNVLVTGEPHIRFYAGAPLISPEGFPLGSLCVIDRVPRTLTDAQQRALRALARMTMQHLELRRSIASGEGAGALRQRLVATATHLAPKEAVMRLRPPASREDSKRALDLLEENLPVLIEQYPSRSLLWLAFRDHADLIEGDAAAQDLDFVRSRIHAMVPQLGLG